MLSVKVAEIQRTEMKRMNVTSRALWSGDDGNVGHSNGGGVMDPAGKFLPNPLKIISQGFFGAFIDDSFKLTMALDVAKENGLAKILAEPTLATLTGQEAEFLSAASSRCRSRRAATSAPSRSSSSPTASDSSSCRSCCRTAAST